MQDIELKPNCSESTWRLNISKLTDEEKQKLTKLLEDLEKTEGNEKIPDTEQWFSTSFWTEKIWGIDTMIIKGEVPYNMSSWLQEKLESLPFWNKIEKEVEEQ